MAGIHAQLGMEAPPPVESGFDFVSRPRSLTPIVWLYSRAYAITCMGQAGFFIGCFDRAVLASSPDCCADVAGARDG
jgi:hypothetical protein